VRADLRIGNVERRHRTAVGRLPEAEVEVVEQIGAKADVAVELEILELLLLLLRPGGERLQRRPLAPFFRRLLGGAFLFFGSGLGPWTARGAAGAELRQGDGGPNEKNHKNRPPAHPDLRKPQAILRGRRL